MFAVLGVRANVILLCISAMVRKVIYASPNKSPEHFLSRSCRVTRASGSNSVAKNGYDMYDTKIP